MASGKVKKSGMLIKRATVTTSSLTGNGDHDISYSSYIDTTKEALDAVLCVGTTPNSTWDTFLFPRVTNLSALTYRFRTIGTTTQTYSVDLVLFYHLK